MLGRDEIAALLPHDGAMLLLDQVESWSAAEITCLTGTHCNPGNPLRRDSGLSVFCGVEYGAQAMAIHGSLLSGDQGRPGVLASLRDLRCHVERLDDIEGNLTIQARLLHGERRSFLYAFTLWAADRALLQGQAGVFLI